MMPARKKFGGKIYTKTFGNYGGKKGALDRAKRERAAGNLARVVEGPKTLGRYPQYAVYVRKGRK